MSREPKHAVLIDGCSRRDQFGMEAADLLCCQIHHLAAATDQQSLRILPSMYVATYALRFYVYTYILLNNSSKETHIQATTNRLEPMPLYPAGVPMASRCIDAHLMHPSIFTKGYTSDR